MPNRGVFPKKAPNNQGVTDGVGGGEGLGVPPPPPHEIPKAHPKSC